MDLEVFIRLPAVATPATTIDATAWKHFVGGFSRGVVLNLGGIIIVLGNKRKTLRAILETSYANLTEIDVRFVQSLVVHGKLYLGSFGSFTTLVNVANGVFDSRKAASIPIPTHRVGMFSALKAIPFRMQNEMLLVGSKPTMRRGASMWDASVVDQVIRILNKNFNVTNKIKDFRFDVYINMDKMYVELTYDGKYSVSFNGKYLELNPAIILGIAIGGFDDQIREAMNGNVNVIKTSLDEVKLEDV